VLVPPDRQQLDEWKQARVAAKPYAYGDDPRQRR